MGKGRVWAAGVTLVSIASCSTSTSANTATPAAAAAESTAAASASSAAVAGSGAVINVAASINAWGSIVGQLGGDHVHASSIITSPDTDPHDYEPTPADGRVIADARLFVENGVGYDAWAAKAVQANPDAARQVIDVGQLLDIPAGGNPHRWYSPADVATVADAITAGLKKIDPADAAYFDKQRQTFGASGLARYNAVIADIKTKFAGVPVGASESIFAPLSDALGLKLLTPPSFLKAISEGTDPSPADESAIDAQIATKQIKVYVFNSQNSTPDVAAQVTAAKAKGIPVVAITETLSPAGASFQDWQSAQLQALDDALATAGR